MGNRAFDLGRREAYPVAILERLILAGGLAIDPDEVVLGLAAR
jgi:hypothetical protein